MRVEFTRWYSNKEAALIDAKTLSVGFGEYVDLGAHCVKEGIWIGWVIV